MEDVAECLRDIPSSRHIIRTMDGGSGHSLVTADLSDDAVDTALARVDGLGVPAQDVALLRLDSIGPVVTQRPLGSVVWADC